MNFRTIADMNRCIVANLTKIPRDLDLIVGIPRSGLLPANMLALHLNLPLADLDGFLNGRILQVGTTGRQHNRLKTIFECRNALVIDDSVWRGSEMERARQKIKAAGMPQNIVFAAVYVSPESRLKVDMFFEEVPFPRLFEWNFMHHGSLSQACLDIDGLICRDPTPDENDDGPVYNQFLDTCEPFLLPSLPVGYLVTCRLEKYREQTERWLKYHGVQYRELIMMDLPSKEARIASRSHGTFKANVYRSKPSSLFIESSLHQSIEIANKAFKPVLCVENYQVILPSFGVIGTAATRKFPMWAYHKTRAAVSHLRKKMFQRVAD